MSVDYQEVDRQQMEQLEALVDLVGLDGVLARLQDIIEAKVMQIQENWQDEGLAKDWDRAGRAIVRCRMDDAVASL